MELITMPTFIFPQGDPFAGEGNPEYPVQVIYYANCISFEQQGNSVVISYDHAKAFDWGATLQNADETLDEKEFDTFLSQLKSPSPRQLVIELNEDGYVPSENGVLIYTEVIY